MTGKTDLPQARPDPIPDSDGQDDFTEGMTYQTAINIASGAKYESLRQFLEARERLSFWDKLKLTWKGKTRVGRVAGTVLDIAEIILPAWAGRMRDHLQSKQTEDKMSKIAQTSTKAGATIIAMILAYFGIEVSAEVLSENLNLILQAITMGIAGITAIIEIIRDEDKPKA